MSVPSALKLRETRDKRKKPVKLAVELTYKEIKAAWLVLGNALLQRGYFSNAEAAESAQSAYNTLGVYVSKFSVLVPENERYFETRRGRKYLCSKCAYTSVVNPGDLCPSCSAPGAA